MTDIISDSTYLEVGLQVAFTLVITYGAQKLVKLIFHHFASNGIHDRFFSNMIVSIIWVVGVVSAISCIPGMTSLARTLLAGSGILAVIAGLAAQDSFGNLFSGMFITLFQPFQIGDRVRLVSQDITGFVEDITLRHTVIRTFVNSRVIVPNAVMNSAIIENSNFTTTVASSFLDICISYESDVKLAMQIMEKEISNHELFLDQRTPEDIALDKPKVTVLVRALSEKGVELRAMVWTKTVDDNFTACSDLRYRIMRDFRENGIEIPYRRVVVIDGKHDPEYGAKN